MFEFILTRFLFMIYFLTYSIFSTEGGQSFMSKFEEPGSSFWSEISGLVCFEQMDCVYFRKENKIFGYVSKPYPKHFLQISLVNDCVDDKICCKKMKPSSETKPREVCTEFSSSMVVSSHSYSYGTFKFFAEIANHKLGLGGPSSEDSGQLHDIWSCFVLEDYASVKSIALCILANEAWEGHATWEDGTKSESTTFYLKNNVGKRLTEYRIDWFPNSISWFVNDVMVHSVDSRTVKIPNTVMQIKHAIIPQMNLDHELHTDYFLHKRRIEVSMLVHHVIYLEHILPIDHDELRAAVLDKPAHEHYRSRALLVITIFTVSCCTVFILKRYSQSKAEQFRDVYVLVDSQSL